MTDKCNILLITLDQIRADVFTGALSGLIPTPNFDRLQAESTVFENHFTVTVPCGPARASLLTGLYAMNHRSIRNGTPLARHHANVATEARKAGYEPLLFGYTDTTPDPTSLDPADPDLQSYEGVAPGFREIVEMRFDTCLAWRAHLKANGYDVSGWINGKDNPFFRPTSNDRSQSKIIDPAFYAAEDSDTAFLTDKTIEALSVRTDHPWFAHLTYIRPHPPFVAPEPYNALIKPDDVPAPMGAALDHPFFDGWFSEPSQKGLFWNFDGMCQNLSAEDTAALRAVYCGLVAELDYHIGRLLDWLDDTGQTDNTVLILTGDHGEMLGEKGMWGKDSVFDTAYHVPLFIRDPAHKSAAGRRVGAITESVDVAPTILTRIGLSPPQAMDGVSLTPWLNSDTPEWRSGAFMEVDFSEPSAPTRFERAWDLPANQCNAAIYREQNMKLVHFNGGVPPLLFNLERDPEENIDLSNDPTYGGELARLTTALLNRRMERNDRRLTDYSIGR